jgi:arsenite-transporting ATPase
MILVTLPESTPVHEAAQLQEDLRRAGIEPFAWAINQSLLLAATRDPLLATRGRQEISCIREVTQTLSRRTVLLPWLAREPVGEAGLAQFFPTALSVAAP